MKKVFAASLVILSVLGGVALLYAIGVFVAVVIFTFPTNDRDNANPSKRAEMVNLTLEWGRLAPFPTSAKEFNIFTEGNSFTRTFRGSFTDSPSTIKAWLDASPGVTEGKKNHDETIVLKMGGGANYGEITVSSDGTHVTFRVSWS